MSIIHDALNKAGQNIVGASPRDPKNSPTARPEIMTAPQKRSVWGPLLAVLVLILVTLPVLSPLARSVFHPATEEALPASGAPFSQFAIEETPLPLPLPRPNLAGKFSVSGIVFSPEGSYSLVNGKVVRIGDTVSGAKVVGISPTTVTLESQGRTTTVPVNS